MMSPRISRPFPFEFFRRLVSALACIGPLAASADPPNPPVAPPVKVGAWVGTLRPAQTHSPLLVGFFRSGDNSTPRFLGWLARQSGDAHLRVLGLSVLETNPGAALLRLRRLQSSVPVGLDAAPTVPKDRRAPADLAGPIAKTWLPLAARADLPVAFLVSSGHIRWYGAPFESCDFGSWLGSRAERRFWRRAARREQTLRQWAANPVKRRVDHISKLIDSRKFGQAQREIGAFQKFSKTDWLDPAKFAPFLFLCCAEGERDIHNFYTAARQIADARETDAPMLNDVAWKIVDPHSRIPRRDWGLAVRLARRAVRLAPTNAGGYDTLGWALYGARQTRSAIRAERRALWFSLGVDEEVRCKNALKLFEKYSR